jgi:hypothetical protein
VRQPEGENTVSKRCGGIQSSTSATQNLTRPVGTRCRAAAIISGAESMAVTALA